MKIIRGRAAGSRVNEFTTTRTGAAWSDPILEDTDGVSLYAVCFAPCSRSFWHTHELGQLLCVTAGEGFVCARGGDPVRIRTGDTVWAPPGEQHWHGASGRSYIVHLAISLGMTEWHEEVAEHDYERALAQP
jgi:quercetin dioxygenase-like cupin family protein